MTCGGKKIKMESLINICKYFFWRVHSSSFHERSYVTNTVWCSWGVGEWEEAALERKGKPFGKLNQKLPEQAVERHGRKEGPGGGGVKENDRIIKASLTRCHTLPSSLSASSHGGPLTSSWHFSDTIDVWTKWLWKWSFARFPPSSLGRALGAQSSDNTLDVLFRNLEERTS